MRRTACLLFFALGCPPSLTHTTGFGVDPDGVQLATSDSSGQADGSSSSTTGNDSTSTGDIGTGPASTGPEPQPDFGQVAPAGCHGKIDFLFVVSSLGTMWSSQELLLKAFPEFYATIESNFTDFDTHIMVVDADEYWSVGDCEYCTDDCDPQGTPPLCGADIGACDSTMGAGVVFPAGKQSSNRRCGLSETRRYMTKDHLDPLETFECLAQVGLGGAEAAVAEAMVQAISPELNAPGGCNDGFLRDDALLVVTLISDQYDVDSDAHIYTWTNKLLAAKHDDPDAFAVLVISTDVDIPEPVCPKKSGNPNRLRTFAEYVPNGMFASICEPSWAPFFATAVESILELCDAFIPQ